MVVALTDKAVQGLRAEGNKRLEVRDAKVRGLVLRVTPAGIKSWSVQHRIKSRAGTQRITLGRYPAMGIARARAAALDIIRTLQDGGDPIAEQHAKARREEAEGLTLAGLVEECLERRRGVVSMTEVERELRKDVLPVLGTKHPAQITAADIAAIVEAIARRGAPSMAR